MPFIVYEPRAASSSEFVEFWSRHVSEKDRELDKQLYERQIQNPLTPDNLRDLFLWKNGTSLSSLKKRTVDSLILRLQELQGLPQSTTPSEFLARFKTISAIWRIFLLHCWSRGQYPIYDQHVHRAMIYILSGKVEEMRGWNGQRKVEAYLNQFMPFLRDHGWIASRTADRALWVYGRFVKSYNFPAVAVRQREFSNRLDSG